MSASEVAPSAKRRRLVSSFGSMYTKGIEVGNDSFNREWNDHQNREITKGRITSEESALIKSQVEKLFCQFGYDWDEGMKRLLYRKFPPVDGLSAFKYIAKILPKRRLDVIVEYVTRRLYNWPRSGRFHYEEDVKLAMLQLAQPPSPKGTWKWGICAEVLGRCPARCCDRVRDLKASGKWESLVEEAKTRMDEAPSSVALAMERPNIDSPVADRKEKHIWTWEEEEELIGVIREVTRLHLPVKGIPWNTVSYKMSQPFTAAQCRHHFRDVLFNRIINQEGRRHRLTRALLQRQYFRFLMKAVEENPKLEWEAINWQAAFSFSPVEGAYLVKPLILHLTEDPIGFPKSGVWRLELGYMAAAIGCFAMEDLDEQSLTECQKYLEEHNGVDDNGEVKITAFVSRTAERVKMHEIMRQELLAEQEEETKAIEDAVAEAITEAEVLGGDQLTEEEKTQLADATRTQIELRRLLGLEPETEIEKLATFSSAASTAAD